MERETHAARRADESRVTRGRERNSALFAAVLSVKRMRLTLRRELDVHSLACVAAACVAGHRAVVRMGDEPWVNAIAAIKRDLTHQEYPPARPGVYTSAAARAAGEAAYARQEAALGGSAALTYGFVLDKAYKEAHYAEMLQADKVWRTHAFAGV